MKTRAFYKRPVVKVPKQVAKVPNPAKGAQHSTPKNTTAQHGGKQAQQKQEDDEDEGDSANHQSEKKSSEKSSFLQFEFEGEDDDDDEDDDDVNHFVLQLRSSCLTSKEQTQLNSGASSTPAITFGLTTVVAIAFGWGIGSLL